MKELQNPEHSRKLKALWKNPKWLAKELKRRRLNRKDPLDIMLWRKFWRKNLSQQEKKKAKSAFSKFGGRCDCCGTRKPGRRGWHLDHKSGKFRGILCCWCNVAAAMLKEDPNLCIKLARYIRKGRRKNSV